MLAKIKDKKLVAEGTLRVEFDLLGKKVDFKAGQYFFITLKNVPFDDDRGNIRHFTIVNTPKENSKIVMTTRLRDSGFKKSLLNLPLGSEVEIGSTQGDFVLPKEVGKPLVFMAGGIGITPFMSMLGHISNQKSDYQITLVYSNRNQAGTAYIKELQKMASKNPNFKLILVMTEDPSWTGETKRVDPGFIKKYFPNLNYYFMVSGPPAMVKAVYESLRKAGVGKSNIKTENFTGY